MAADVQPTAQVKLATQPGSLTPEQTYWRSFKSPLKFTSPTNHAITHISQPLSPSSVLQSTTDFFVVSTGARIQLYSTKTRKLIKTISRFDDVAYGGEVRYDGRVLAAGDETGAIQVFDVGSRAILKTWKEQKQPVHTVKWNPKDATGLMSCGDDATVRLWDLPTDTSISTFRGHQDYVRTGCFLPAQSGDLLVSGSYDQTVCLWDSRSPAPALTFKHNAPVEDVICMPSGTTVLAAAGNQVAVLDIVAGKPLHMIKNHQKTVTSLCLASQGTRLVAGALDGHLKVFETTGWNVVAGSKYAAPILSLAVMSTGVTREDKHIAVGMANGQLSIKTRLSGEQKVKERARQKEMEALLAGTIEEHDRKVAKLAKKRGKGLEKRFRGRDFIDESADIIIEGNDRSNKAKKLKQWDRELHLTRYAEALDAAIASRQTPIVLSILTQLRYRSALRASLENRNEQTLLPVLLWVHKNISSSSVTVVGLCVEVAMNIFDIYARHVGNSTLMQEQTEKLYARVKEEVERSKQATATRGMLELMVPGISNNNR